MEDSPDNAAEMAKDTAVERTVEIVNVQGLHARPVMRFVDIAGQYQAGLTVEKNGECVDGKSPMEMMILEAPKGTKLHMRATGPDAEEMVDALAELIAAKFGED